MLTFTYDLKVSSCMSKCTVYIYAKMVYQKETSMLVWRRNSPTRHLYLAPSYSTENRLLR